MPSARRLVGLLVLAAPLLLGADASLARERGAAKHEVSRRAGRVAPHEKKRRAMRARPPSRTASTRSDEPLRARPRGATLPILQGAIRCPPDMVAVAGRVCVDRFETSLVDARSGEPWSPYYAPSPEVAARVAGFYDLLREKAAPGSLEATLPLPPPPTSASTLKAVSREGAIPQGYLTADDAERACRAADKRLCTESEWLTACRGEAVSDFPYGDHYEQGACNVVRESHPSFLLHGNAARYHDDPRNNLVRVNDAPLLRATGATPRCASRWGADAVLDMVGNLDEWVADEGGVFVGGFYSRGTRSGCFSRVSNHPRTYSDYSTGARCCADPLAGP